ncbi:S-adenosyl methyltransferase [Kibdelosporangium aridum]|uniref:S-adenosyl methyltransferase n=2 Tax=Kibdelosporangium aridum TaxID=2030 RepID=A0A1W2EYV7_KIBAR|nr:S-adenosyl methyltransferase [Kibdelosporangium aridum]
MAGNGRYPTPRRHIDLDRPNIFRVYDYYLGGTTNWAIDRFFGDQVLRKSPLMSDIARTNQVFLNRVIRYLVESGVQQFVDVGSGVLTRDNTHQVADALAFDAGREPDVRVVYTAPDPITVAHAEVLLDRDGDPRRHAVVEADLLEPAQLWAQVEDVEILDLNQPVALLLITALQVQQRRDLDGLDLMDSVVQLRERLPAGSYIALSHLTEDAAPADICERLAEVKRMYSTWTDSSLVWRSHEDIARVLAGLELVKPGWTSNWHVDESFSTRSDVAPALPSPTVVWAGLGHKP